MNMTDFIGTIVVGIVLFCFCINLVLCQLISGRDTSQIDKLLREKQ
jgi:Na+/H+-dicarboxylate symporter